MTTQIFSPSDLVNATSEAALENEIILKDLATGGWVVGGNALYDPETGLIPQDLRHWVAHTELDVWNDYLNKHQGNIHDAERALARDVRKRLDATPHGTMAVLHQGIRLGSANKMVRFMGTVPVRTDVQEPLLRYQNNLLRVVQQLDITGSRLTIPDLVFFLNGLPMSTWELKSSAKQTIRDAVEQFKTSRKPSVHVIYHPIKGAVVHFAVSSNYVKMITALNDNPDKVVVLPFDPSKKKNTDKITTVANGPATSFLWQDVFSRESFLDLVSDYVFVENDAPVFPRYHQLDVVRLMVDNVLNIVKYQKKPENALIQHSPGSGKTKTLIWLSHHLSRLHADNQKVFKNVIVITDRLQLDGQFKEARQYFTKGEIFEAATSGADLAEKIQRGVNVITTLQKFREGIANKTGSTITSRGRVAILIDEAHSSQGGEYSRQMADTIEKLSGEDVFAFALTATPIEKTFEIFGKKTDDGARVASHVYSMKQAIDEGFILRVLQNYAYCNTEYLLDAGKNANALIEKKSFMQEISAATLSNIVSIQAKVPKIVDHFKNNVAKKEWAKAMIVCETIPGAVLYFEELQKEMARQNLDYKVLITFTKSASTDKTDRELNQAPGNVTNMDDWIKSTLDLPEYRFLIVVDKFLTGFDQPKLSAMYIDKKMGSDSVLTVQALNRLNRTYKAEKQDRDVYIVDFVNGAEVIMKAFKPYYEDIWLEGESNVALLAEQKRSLEENGLTQAEAEAFFNTTDPRTQQTILKRVVAQVVTEHITTVINTADKYIHNYFFARVAFKYPDDSTYVNFLKVILRGLIERREEENPNLIARSSRQIAKETTVVSAIVQNPIHMILVMDEGDGDAMQPMMGETPSENEGFKQLMTAGDVISELNGESSCLYLDILDEETREKIREFLFRDENILILQANKDTPTSYRPLPIFARVRAMIAKKIGLEILDAATMNILMYYSRIV